MAFRHEVLHIRRQKQRLIDIPAAKILAHRPRLNQTRSELNSRYSDRLLVQAGTRRSTKKPRTMPGLCRLTLAFGSVLPDGWTGPVEPVDQRRRNRLVPGVGPDVAANEGIGHIEQLVRSLGIVEGRAIFSLHEPAGRLDAEHVQVVLDAATDEPTVAIVTVEMNTGGNASQ